MFPFAHLTIAEKYFKELTNELKLGTILPDFLTALHDFSMEDTHVLLNNFGSFEFERAWNLHILVDEFTEKKYFYPNIPPDLRNKVGSYVGHIFVESAFDQLMWSSGVYFPPPKIEESVIDNLEKYFKKNLIILKPMMQLFLTWDERSYPEHLIDSLLYICGVNQCVFTKTQVKRLLVQCKKSLPEPDELIIEVLDNIRL